MQLEESTQIQAKALADKSRFRIFRFIDGRTIMLDHCPFADVAAQNPDIVCDLHRGLIEGRLQAAGVALGSSLEPRDPHQAGCRVGLFVGAT